MPSTELRSSVKWSQGSNLKCNICSNHCCCCDQILKGKHLVWEGVYFSSQFHSRRGTIAEQECEHAATHDSRMPPVCGRRERVNLQQLASKSPLSRSPWNCIGQLSPMPKSFYNYPQHQLRFNVITQPHEGRFTFKAEYNLKLGH